MTMKNDELKKYLRKEISWPISTFFISLYIQGQTKLTDNLRIGGSSFKPGTPEYKSD